MEQCLSLHPEQLLVQVELALTQRNVLFMGLLCSWSFLLLHIVKVTPDEFVPELILMSISILSPVVLYSYWNRKRLSLRIVRSIFTTALCYSGLALVAAWVVEATMEISHPPLCALVVLGVMLASWAVTAHASAVDLARKKAYLKEVKSGKGIQGMPSELVDPPTQSLIMLSDTKTKLFQDFADLWQLSQGYENRRPEDTLEDVRIKLKSIIVRQAADAKAKVEKKRRANLLQTLSEVWTWLWQKKGELFQLNTSDLLMGFAVAEARRCCQVTESRIVSVDDLAPIHAIDRADAIAKTRKRGQAVAAAYEILEKANWHFTQSLCYAHKEFEAFQSLTGFEVVEIDGKYVTFEGNGRNLALQWGMEELRKSLKKHVPLQVEVTVYNFSATDLPWVVGWMNATREAKGVMISKEESSAKQSSNIRDQMEEPSAKKAKLS